MGVWVFTWKCMLVGLGNANFIMNHKFTEKRQNNCETKEVDDRCAHGVVRGMLWEEHQGRKRGAESMKEENRAGARLRAHWGSVCWGLGRHKTPLDLWEGCYWGWCIWYCARYGEGLQGISRTECVVSLKETERNVFQFSSVQSRSCAGLFVTRWTAARQAFLSITNSRSLLKLMSIELVMPSNQLILCCPLLLLPSIFPTIRVFSNIFQGRGKLYKIDKISYNLVSKRFTET